MNIGIIGHTNILDSFLTILNMFPKATDNHTTTQNNWYAGKVEKNVLYTVKNVIAIF